MELIAETLSGSPSLDKLDAQEEHPLSYVSVSKPKLDFRTLFDDRNNVGCNNVRPAGPRCLLASRLSSKPLSRPPRPRLQPLVRCCVPVNTHTLKHWMFVLRTSHLVITSDVQLAEVCRCSCVRFECVFCPMSTNSEDIHSLLIYV